MIKIIIILDFVCAILNASVSVLCVCKKEKQAFILYASFAIFFFLTAVICLILN